MAKVTNEDRNLMAEVSANPRAEELLRHKCHWEQLTRFVVLREYGDPRKWDSYVRGEE